MFDSNQSKTIDLFLENPEEKTIIVKEDHILEQLKQEDVSSTFQDYEFINLIRSSLINEAEQTSEDRAEIAEQLPYAPTKQKLLSRILRLLGWRYFHRIDDVGMLHDIESLQSGIKYSEAEEFDEEKLVMQEEGKDDGSIEDLLTMEEEEEGEIFRVAKRFFIIDLLNKLRKLFIRSNIVLGFELGTNNVKFAQIRKKKSQSILDRYRINDIGRKPEDSAEIFRSKTILALQKILPLDLLAIADVSVMISNLPVIITSETMPALDSKELDQAIMFRAQKMVPETIKNPHIEYEVIEKIESQDSSQIHLRIYIIDQDELELWLQALRECGISPQKVTLPHMAIQHNLAHFYPQELVAGVALFDIGSDKSQLIFAGNNTLKLIRTFEIGVDDFIKSLTGSHVINDQEIDISRKRAEDLLKTYGVMSTNTEEKTEYDFPVARTGIMLYNDIEKMVNDVQRSLDYYMSTFPESPIHSILITGGGANIANLRDKLEDKLNLPVMHYSYLNNLTIGRDVTEIDQVLQDAHIISGSVGLALDESNKLNLLPKQLQTKKQTNLIFLGIALISLISASFIAKETYDLNNSFSSYQAQLNVVKSELESRMPQRNEYFSLQEQMRAASDFQYFVADQLNIQIRHDSIKNILLALSNHKLPRDIVINSMMILERQTENIISGNEFQTILAPRRILIKGKTTSGDHERSLAEYVIYLRNFPFFERITPQPYDGVEAVEGNYFQILMYIHNGDEYGSE